MCLEKVIILYILQLMLVYVHNYKELQVSDLLHSTFSIVILLIAKEFNFTIGNAYD